MLIKIIIALAAVAAVFVVIVSLRPSHFHIARSIAVAAPPQAIFPHVNTARAWDAWSPWVKLDPNMKVSYEGPASGIGAVTAFEGKKAGTGRCTIVDSRAPDRVQFRLDMTAPFAGTNDVVFTFVPEGDKTVVTWSMEGESTFATKAIGLFINCDRVVAEQFDKGLADLKTLVEGQEKKVTLAQAGR